MARSSLFRFLHDYIDYAFRFVNPTYIPNFNMPPMFKSHLGNKDVGNCNSPSAKHRVQGCIVYNGDLIPIGFT